MFFTHDFPVLLFVYVDSLLLGLCTAEIGHSRIDSLWEQLISVRELLYSNFLLRRYNVGYTVGYLVFDDA